MNLQLFAVSDDLPNLMRSRALGLGSTGRTVPNTLLEQLAMKEVLSDPLRDAMVLFPLNDPRWIGTEGWRKMQRVIDTSEGKVVIHFNHNLVTGAFDDFKFSP